MQIDIGKCEEVYEDSQVRQVVSILTVCVIMVIISTTDMNGTQTVGEGRGVGTELAPIGNVYMSIEIWTL